MSRSSVLYLILTLVVIIHSTLYFTYGISLRGYWSEKILVWLWLLSTCIFIACYFRKTIIKFYFAVLLVLAALSTIPFGIPIIVFIAFVTGRDRDFHYTLNSGYRLQSIFKSPMVGPKLELVKESVLYEKVVGTISNDIKVQDKYYNIEDATSIVLRFDSVGRERLWLMFPTGEIYQYLDVEQ